MKPLSLFTALGTSALTLSLTLLPMTLPQSASAQTSPGEPAIESPATQFDGGYRADDNYGNWGLLGLLGLVGLWGLRGRRTPDYTGSSDQGVVGTPGSRTRY